MNSNRSTFWLSVMAMTIVLVFLQFWALLSLHGQKLGDAIRSNIPIVVELNTGSDRSQANLVVGIIKDLEEYNEGSAQYYSAEDAVEVLSADFDDLYLDSISSPFGSMITFNIDAPFYNQQRLERVKKNLGGTRSCFRCLLPANWYGGNYGQS